MNVSEIAKLAGVSCAAVSRYFNNGCISEEKRRAIQKAVEETGYRPSLQAQTLRTKKTKMIGVIAPKMASDSIGRVIEGILSVTEQSEYQTLLAVTQNNAKKELEYLSAFREKQVDGLILIATVFTAEHKRMLKSLTVPLVIVGQQMNGQCCVFHDDYHAAYDLTKHVLEKGRKNLGYIGATRQDKAVGAERYRGFCDAVRSMGYESLTQNYVTADFTVSSGYEKAKELLRRHPELDGIVCAADSMAAGARKYLFEQGIAVPDQILLAGHDDSDIVKVTAPPLVTVHFSYEKSGETAARMLMEMIASKKTFPQEVKLGYCITE